MKEHGFGSKNYCPRRHMEALCNEGYYPTAKTALRWLGFYLAVIVGLTAVLSFLAWG